MMVEIAKPFVTHLSNFERQELEVMGEFMTMDFDEVDYVFQNIETSREGKVCKLEIHDVPLNAK